jgi:ABC-type branched-subunit amino acid transport system ATPase component/branched-subunit amino acid ABC-type transport system permease component
MTSLLPFIVAGLTSGAVYGLAGVGLVLTYKTSGVFNFAYGALATVSAYVFYALFVQSGWSWPLAAAIAVLIVGPIMGLALELLARRLQGTSLALRVAGTVGLMLAIEAVIALIWTTATVRQVPPYLPQSGITILKTNVQWSSVITFLFAVIVTAVLSVFFRVSRSGVAMRAVVDDPDLLAIIGTNPARTRRLSWVIGSTLAAASGVLFAPLLELDPVQLTLLVVSAFGAAAVGRFSSLPVTMAGGLGIGVLASLCTKWFLTGALAGLPPSMPFVVLFVVLLVLPKRWLLGKTFLVPRSRPAWTPPASMQLSGGTLLLIFLAIVPAWAGIHLTDWTVAVAMTIVFMSLAMLVRTSGQVSLAQVAFTAIGAATFSHLTLGSGIPWLLALLLAGLIAVPVGAVLAIPAIRLTGLYLALATFGFTLLLQEMFYTQGYLFGNTGAGLNEPMPHLSWLNVGSPTGYYYVVLVIAAIVAGLVVVLTRSRLGRLLRGMSDSTTALSTSGASVNVTRTLVFCLAAFLAAIGGALAAVAQSSVAASGYPPLLSLTYFVVVIVIGGSEVWCGVIAAGAMVLIPAYITGTQVPNILQLIFGVSAVAVAITPAALREVPAPIQNAVDALFRRNRGKRSADDTEIAHAAPSNGSTGAASPSSSTRIKSGALELADLRVRFGGVVAVDGVSLRAPTGTITGLIGPNGAGKTTTFNACSGLATPTGGHVVLDGSDITRRGVATRARHGIGRTFQKMELLDSLTVRENVAVGAEAELAGPNPLSHVLSRRHDRRRISRATADALSLCDLAELADHPVATLSTGQRRLVELARCLAGDFRILLLDEPSSGLDPTETKRFGAILRRAVAERGVGVLLVEHDMSLVLDLCESIYVLDFGEPVFHGTPAELVASPIVQSAYLGDSRVEAALAQEAETPADTVAVSQ